MNTPLSCIVLWSSPNILPLLCALLSVDTRTSGTTGGVESDGPIFTRFLPSSGAAAVLVHGARETYDIFLHVIKESVCLVDHRMVKDDCPLLAQTAAVTQVVQDENSLSQVA